jgi:hypothetical protein
LKKRPGQLSGPLLLLIFSVPCLPLTGTRAILKDPVP